MTMTTDRSRPWRDVVPPTWSWLLPLFAWLAIVFVPTGGVAGFMVSSAALFGTVFAAVRHAEVIGERVGEPFGSIILALAVTIIEVGLIVSITLGADLPGESTLARDTVFAAVMLVCNGVLGLSILISGLRFHEPEFRPRAAASYLAVLFVLASAVLVLPGFTRSAVGPIYTQSQLGFAAAVSLGLYIVFLFVQTVSHRDTFMPAVPSRGGETSASPSHPRPSGVTTAIAGLLLPVALSAVVMLAEHLAPELEQAMRSTGVAQPAAIVGVIVAALVLLPEAISAFKAAGADRLQTSVNLSLGSALASIALTIPSVALISLWLAQPLILGLDGKNLILLGLTFVVATLTLGSGRATILQGAVHLVILALFLFFVVVP